MPSRQSVVQLRGAAPVVLPSLLLCDFGNLERDVRRLEDAGVRGLHLDVMDGHFVPNLTYGMPLVEAIRKLTDLPLDVHLMISDPAQYASQFCDAGADGLTIHIEAAPDPAPILQQIQDLGAAAGLAFNPNTPVEAIEPYLPLCDIVLVMSVMPGFGGQAFNAVAIEKLKYLSDRIGPEQSLEVDGGIALPTIASCAGAGAHLFVVGSAIFGTSDYAVSVSQLEERARTAFTTTGR